MPFTGNTSAARRKVRCPKCTALLTEPPTPIYECPICSTLLLAKDTSRESGGRFSDNRANGTSRGHQDAEQSSEGGLKPEKARFNDNPQEKWEPHGLNDSESEHKPSHEGGTLSAPSTGTPSYDVSSYASRRRLSHSSAGSRESFDKSEHGAHFSGADSSSENDSEDDLDSPPWSSDPGDASRSPDFCLSVNPLDSSNVDDKQGKTGQPETLDFKLQTLELNDTVQNGHIDGIQKHALEDPPKDLNIEEDASCLESGDQKICDEGMNTIQGSCTDIRDSVSDSLDYNEGSIRNLDKPYSSVHDSFAGVSECHGNQQLSETGQCTQNNWVQSNTGFDGLSDGFKGTDASARLKVGSETTGVTTVSSSDESFSGNDTVKEEGEQDLNVIVCNSAVEDRGCQNASSSGKLTDMEILGKDSKSDGSPALDETASTGDANTLEDNSRLSRSVFDGKDSQLEANARYADVWMEKLVSTEIASIDFSFCDWQSSGRLKAKEALKNSVIDSDSVDDKRILNSDETGDDSLFPALLEENEKLNQGCVQIVEAPTRALSGTRMIDSIPAGETTAGSIPRRTVKMQKLLQNNDPQIADGTQIFGNAEAGLYESSHLEEYQSHGLPSTSGMNDEWNTEDLMSDNTEQWKASDIPLTVPSLADDPVRQHDLFRDELTYVQPHLVEEVVYRKELHPSQNAGAQRLLKRGGMHAGQHRGEVHDIAGDVSQPDEWPRSYDRLDNRMVASDTVQSRDERRYGVAPQQRQFQETDHVTPSELNMHMKGNVSSLDSYRPGSADSHLEERGTATPRQMIPHGGKMIDSYPLRGSADHYSGHPSRLPKTSPNPNIYPDEHYASDTQNLSLPNNRGYTFQAPYPNFMVSASSQEQSFEHCAHHHSMFCASELQQPYILPNNMPHYCAACVSQVPPIASMSVIEEPYHMQPHASSSVREYQAVLPPMYAKPYLKSHGYQTSLPERQNYYPPLPRQGAAPFVLCRDCNQLLQVPACLPPNSGTVLKLKCGACGKKSKFSTGKLENSGSHKRGRGSTNRGLAAVNMTNASHFTYSSLRPKLSSGTVQSSSFMSNDHARLPHVINNRVSRVENREWVENQMLPQTNAAVMNDSDVESPDYAYHRQIPTAGYVKGHRHYGLQMRHGNMDTVVNSSGMFNEGYLSSSPSSTSGSSPVRHRSEQPAFEAVQRRRTNFAGQKGNNSLHSQMHEQVRPAETMLSFPEDYDHRGSGGTAQEEYLIRNPLRRNLVTLKNESQQEGTVDSDFSRSSSQNSASQFRKLPAAPGSPLIEHFSRESRDYAVTMQKRGLHLESVSGSRSVPWSPAPGSPLYDHLRYDMSSDFDDRSSQKSWEASKFQDSPAQDSGKGPRYFAGLLKKGFRDFGKGGQANNNRRKVVINGHLISDAMVKKAEEQAGAIHPGSYWYDFLAGFWGVMGGPCLGIIPPFIQEFNFPLPRDSAGGRTGVVVNGRELHEQDLQILAKRGLPTTRGKTYVVDITGDVLDEPSGQRLLSLGKLAPSLEKKGRGSGMFHPGVQSRIQFHKFDGGSL